MTRWYHRAARKEFIEASQWYEDQREGLGEEFLAEVRRTLERIEDNPRRFPKVFKDMRRALVRRFPYQVLFVASGDLVSIFAVFHSARNPEIWKHRRD